MSILYKYLTNSFERLHGYLEHAAELRGYACLLAFHIFPVVDPLFTDKCSDCVPSDHVETFLLFPLQLKRAVEHHVNFEAEVTAIVEDLFWLQGDQGAVGEDLGDRLHAELGEDWVQILKILQQPGHARVPSLLTAGQVNPFEVRCRWRRFLTVDVLQLLLH